MNTITAKTTIGVLASGGMDSCVLMGRLLEQDRVVQPFYVCCGLIWEAAELAALKRFLAAIARPRLKPPVVFEMPLADLYGTHWSIDGRGTPDARSADEAVYLPGRNALLLVKPALWCAMQGIEELALATLAGNPFSDATDDFFCAYQAALRQATGSQLTMLRPFARSSKADVLRLGQHLPLELSFSCLRPQACRPCGECNKCAERQHVFRLLGRKDPTLYATKRDNSAVSDVLPPSNFRFPP